MTVDRWVRCSDEDCDARWRGTDEENCWACGAPGIGGFGPRITSGVIVNAMTDSEWKEIKRREGVD